MIGVVGSVDSARLVVQVAQEMRLSESLIVRSYEHLQEAPAIASEIDPTCTVILFTGRVPYALTHARVRLTALSDYIPHSGVDLYRALVVLAREHGGAIPRLSIDTIDDAVITENFAEIGEAPPAHVYALDPVLDSSADIETIVEFHRALHAAGEVELCVTCLSSVRDVLQMQGIPVLRVAHTHSSVRDSLQKATLTSQLQRSHSSQVAVLTVAIGGSGAAEQTQETVAASLKVLATAVAGHLVDDGPGLPFLTTTRGALERELGRDSGTLQRAVEVLDPVPAWIGVGYGDSLAHAEEQAHYALSIAAATRDHQVVLPDGSTRRLIDGAQTRVRVRDTDTWLQNAARRSGVGPMTLSRLRATLASVGSNELTAKELARAYGVEPRSARRLLNALSKAGLVKSLGSQSPPRAGRPQVIYQINLEALLSTNGPPSVPVALELERYATDHG